VRTKRTHATFAKAPYDFKLGDYDFENGYIKTILNFQSGDVMQAIEQIDNDWGDGITNGIRGWFPTNHCEFTPMGLAEDGDERGQFEETDGVTDHMNEVRPPQVESSE
jgi:son of sevenless-like protein